MNKNYILIYKTQNIKERDIVTFKRADGFVTHRVTKISGNKVITKGDANNVEDDEIDISDIIGKVIYVGWILNFVIDFKYAIISI